MTKQIKKDYTSAVGRRRTSISRVRLFKGKGETVVNGQPIEKYFADFSQTMIWDRPFELTQTKDKYWASVKVVGGGRKGQLGSVIHGISRVLSAVDPEKHRSILKKYGLLTRDPRERERRKVGTGGKARRKKQSPKR